MTAMISLSGEMRMSFLARSSTMVCPCAMQESLICAGDMGWNGTPILRSTSILEGSAAISVFWWNSHG